MTTTPSTVVRISVIDDPAMTVVSIKTINCCLNSIFTIEWFWCVRKSNNGLSLKWNFHHIISLIIRINQGRGNFLEAGNGLGGYNRFSQMSNSMHKSILVPHYQYKLPRNGGSDQPHSCSCHLQTYYKCIVVH